MSRQSKMARKRRAHVKRAEWVKSENKAVSTGNAGPARTTPCHGKTRRWPYDAEWRKQHCGGQG